jgi:hypothetical protein
MSHISISWLRLKPNENNHGNQEYFDEYYERIKDIEEFAHIPKHVFKQWIWAHHKNPKTLENYAWLNYENVEFQLCNWSNSQFSNIYVIEPYKDYYQNRSNFNDISSFCCRDKDLKHWLTKGTWRTPPIILDVESLNDNYPTWSELNPPLQLVEGHSRLGYLNSMIRISKLGKQIVADNHEIYLMKLKSTNA